MNNGSVTVTCEYNGFYVLEKSQCIKWFTSLDQISKAELVDISNGLDCGSVVSIADDLGGASMAYLSINNKISATACRTTGRTCPSGRNTARI